MIPMGLSKWWTAGAWFCVALTTGLRVNAAEDWRLEFLAAEKLSSDTDSLRALSESYNKSPELLGKAVVRLSAQTYAERLQAQNEILLMGPQVLPQIRNWPETNEPEVRLRLAEITSTLESGGRWKREDLLRTAVTGLLHEREHPGAVHASRRMFVELFRESQDTLEKGYGRMHFKSVPTLKGLVKNGKVVLQSTRIGEEADQRLYIEAADIVGKAEFPDRFRVDVKLGGLAGGEGNFHVGVAVGNVRALFHPGLTSGAFRFELVSDHRFISQNEKMGFDPPTDQMLPMSIEVARLENGKVKMNVMVSEGEKTFRTSKVFEASDIGKLDQISLDRSGREGGSGIFDDLIVDFSQP